MLLCPVCEVPMSVCSCWLTELDEQRDNFEADYPYRYDSIYDYDNDDDWLINAAEYWQKMTKGVR